MGVEITGMDALNDMLGDLAHFEAEIPLIRSCAYLEGQAKLLCPVGEIGGGELRNSISYATSETEGEVYTAKTYAPYVEVGTGLMAGTEPDVSQFLGTGRQKPWVYYNEKLQSFFTTAGMKPRPFMAPALNRNRAKIERFFAQAIDEAMAGG